ncbi:hypothetical protein COT98_01665 [Candidatus Falkowbacteria bacterium CG10_big_fil_rev_8_21_14_0_10_39_9]|uniref:Glycoside hydrolase family 57 N-terminal domain-containing protein n=1 Tax=Candidatus Falkowbacteria bacterium CG10_big_fil_rev_8_21_14_0_10_39_9 TaxID=1974566 RepID=A0A2M6WQ64_9BACT|nr:MAG: hypothetical protein COT98_01665 [Candidatus Falkowbacteria bacterium CG10_big_fil_rev_8_21_14_0_10_39_9]
MVNKTDNLWLNFLHLYQPANTDPYHIQEAVEKSYARLVRALEEHPSIKFTFNISGCLLLRLEELGYFDLIARIKKLIAKKQLEITGTAAYHALLPLVDEAEVVWQIKENEAILQKHFGADFKPQGFFLPEMAYGPQVAKIIKKLGYKWIVVDEILINGQLNKIDFSEVYLDENSGLKVVCRSRRFSGSYVPDNLKDFFGDNKTIITATDGELYGLRHEDPTGELEKLLKTNFFTTQLMSDFVSAEQKTVKVKLLSGNWESTPGELKKQEPYALWQKNNNKIQKAIWSLANLAQELSQKHVKAENYHWSRWHLVRGLASCTFWWASGRDFSANFGPRAWSPDEIERGINELIRSIRSLHDHTTQKTKIKAEKMYLQVQRLIWEKHWRYYWPR